MKIAIHHRIGSFSEAWINYCKENNINYKIVNCYLNDIIVQLEGCDALMWHHTHADYRDVLFANKLLFAVEAMGIAVFPNFKTTWHFDDKVGQKYLLESVNAPLVPSYVFYDKKSALLWAKEALYPKVFKLRGGAGASNVKLVKSYSHCKRLINKAFSGGFSVFNNWKYFSERYFQFIAGKDSFLSVMKGLVRIFIPTDLSKMQGKEKGYIYFQEFIPNNSFDVRLIVIDDKAYGMKRLNRENDFRASGSNSFVYDELPEELLRIGFDVSHKLQLQTAAFDFIFDSYNQPLIVEVSFGYGTKGSSLCPGYWDKDCNWHKGNFNPHGWMVENVIKEIQK
jgi:glutathione synthase/RimK-type ligase-like ATP-grasp enzyme